MTTPTQTPQTRKSKKMTQERFMILLTLVFVIGWVLFTIIPEDTPMRGVVTPLVLGVVVWAMYKWGV